VTNPIIGINVSGAEYSWETYPTTSDLDYLKSNGITLLRVPFAWEKIQPTIYGPLSSTELGNMNAFLTALAARGMSAIIDMHNYARYTLNWATLDNIGTGTEGTTGSIIGSAAVPFSSFKDVWTKLAAALKGHSGLVGYDIMNEPNTMPNACVWPTAAQAAVDGIRSVDMNTTIYVEGDNWASASTWQTANANLHIVDPASRLVYEAHQYFDDGSGRYTKTYDQYGATPTRGIDQLQPFLKWLKQNNAKGFVGEFGVPQDDLRWLAVLDNFIAALVANDVGGTYWQYNYRTPQGVSWWPNWHEPMSVIRIQDWGTPQLDVIKKYVQPASKGTP
jgi:endoglucanase